MFPQKLGNFIHPRAIKNARAIDKIPQPQKNSKKKNEFVSGSGGSPVPNTNDLNNGVNYNFLKIESVQQARIHRG